MPFSSDALSGITVLMVEDDRFVAEYVLSVIRAAGGAALGPFPSSMEAVASLAEDVPRPQVALLNITVGDKEGFCVADELTRTSIPVIFSSGHPAVELPSRFSSRPLLTKPFAAYQIVEELIAVVNRHD
jgi:DNA-binding response OmpR family regulator